MPVRPIMRSIGAAARRKRKVAATMPAIRPTTASRTLQSGAWPISRIMVAMAPGPAMSGVASGKTEGS